MPDITIHVAEKTAEAEGDPVIVCGNSDYQILFSFDSEWDAYTVKTARFVFMKNGALLYEDTVFEGDTCTAPVLYDTDCVAVGVYAGNIRTTTPARIPCARCITDSASVHPDPPPDVYTQILEYLAGLETAGLIIGDAVLLADGTDCFAAGTASNWEEL